jgi:hypothetical protein
MEGERLSSESQEQKKVPIRLDFMPHILDLFVCMGGSSGHSVGARELPNLSRQGLHKKTMNRPCF